MDTCISYVLYSVCVPAVSRLFLAERPVLLCPVLMTFLLHLLVCFHHELRISGWAWAGATSFLLPCSNACDYYCCLE